MSGESFVRVVYAGDDFFVVRFPSGRTGAVRNNAVQPEHMPMKVGDEIPWSKADNGNILIHFGRKRSA